MSSFEKLSASKDVQEHEFIEFSSEKQKVIEPVKGSATERFLSDLDNLKLSGNPELKEYVRRNIIEAEKNNTQFYEEAAKIEGVTVQQLKEKLQKKVEDLVSQSDFFKATGINVLEKVMLTDGRFKTQFEPEAHGWSPDIGYRSSAEHKMFGIPDDIKWSPTSRPVYGYFSDNEHGGINNEGSVPPPSCVSHYGRINFKLKKEKIIGRTTVTFADSLGVGAPTPTPAEKPHFTSFPRDYYKAYGGQKLENINSTSATNWSKDEVYTEAQYQGGLTMEDVESIHISKKNGMTEENMQEARDIYRKYMELHPDSQLKLIEY